MPPPDERIPGLDRCGPLTLRWREARTARGRLRLAQRVRAGLTVEELAGVLRTVVADAFADELYLEWASGAGMYVHRSVLEDWISGRRSDLPPIAAPCWAADIEGAAARAAALDGMRVAIARLQATGVIDEHWADDLVRKVHIAAQSLPVSSLAPWRA